MSIARRVLLFSILASLPFVAACTGGGGARGPASLVIQLQAEPVSLDPALAEDGHALRILANTMDGLVGYDEDGALELRLAKSYRVSPDGLRVEFVLRGDAKWSDGEPVRAAHFVDGVRRSLDPATASRLSSLLPAIRGVRAEGDRVVFELERPVSYFVEALTHSVAAPIRRDILDANHGRWPELAPSTGPYRVVEHRTGQFYRLEPNPHYHDKEALDGALPVKLQLVQDESTAAALFESGTLDILTRVPSYDLARLRGMGVVDVSPFLATYYIAFNVRKGPFRDVRWRRAVAASIRKEEVVKAMQTGESPASSWIPRGLDGYFPYREPGPSFVADAAAVRAELKGRKARRRVELLFDGNSRNQLVAEKIQKDLESELGLRITLDSLDWKSFVRTLHSGPPAIFRFAWLAPFADPITHLQVFTTGNPNNHTGWSNRRYDRLVEEIASLPKGQERRNKVLAAQKLLLEVEVAVVPIYHYVQVHAIRKNVKAFKVNPFGVIHFERLRKID